LSLVGVIVEVLHDQEASREIEELLDHLVVAQDALQQTVQLLFALVVVDEVLVGLDHSVSPSEGVVAILIRHEHRELFGRARGDVDLVVLFVRVRLLLRLGEAASGG